MNLAVVARTGGRLALRELWFAGRPRRALLPLALAALIALGIGFGSAALFAELARAHAPLAWSQHVLAWTFTLAFVLLGLSDVQLALSALVSASDLERLRAAPLTARQLLALKLSATLPRTLWPVLVVALPVALGYATVHGQLPPLSLASALFALWAVPLGAGLALALPLLRVAPAARVRETLAVLATFAFVAGWLVNMFWIPRLAGDGATLSAGLAALPAPPAWSPASWAAATLFARAPDVFGECARCVLAGLAALALAAAAATQLLSDVQSRAAAARGRTVRASARRAPTLALAFLRRDTALLARDWPLALDTLAGLALWSLLPLALLPLASLPRLELARGMLITLSVSLGHDVAARALPLERTALAWARLSPVGGARWLKLRLLGVAIVNGTLLLAAAAWVCGGFGLRGREVLDVLAFGTAAVTSATATGLIVGAALGDPAWSNPRAMLGLGGRNLSVWALLLQSGVWLACSHALASETAAAPWQLMWLLAASAVFTWLMLALAARVLDQKQLTGP